MEGRKMLKARSRRAARSDRGAYEAWRRLLFAALEASRPALIDADWLFRKWNECRKRDERLSRQMPPPTIGGGGALQGVMYRGHDMESTIGVGDKVYYDPEIQVIDGDGLYVLKPAGILIVRRLVAESGGRVCVVADSQNKTLYPSQIYADDELHMLNIVGKVVGWKKEGITLPGDRRQLLLPEAPYRNIPPGAPPT